MEMPLVKPRLVVHLVRRIDAHELDGGVLGLIRHMPPGRYRHVVVCLARRAGDRNEAMPPGLAGVDVIGLGSAGGPGAGYLGILRLLRRLRPDLVHTRTLDCQLLAALAGVKSRVHGALHSLETHGTGEKILKWMLRPQVVPPLHRGVDSLSFHPRLAPPAPLGPAGFMADGALVLVSAGHIGDTLLAQAFAALAGGDAYWQRRLRLVQLGEGPGRLASHELLARAGFGHRCWYPGWRPGLAQVLRSCDIFVDTGDGAYVLEAMASGLAVLVQEASDPSPAIRPGESGLVVGRGDPAALAAALESLCLRPDLVRKFGAQARRQVIEQYSLPVVAGSVVAVYDAVSGHPLPT